jgi:hypothetical protein
MLRASMLPVAVPHACMLHAARDLQMSRPCVLQVMLGAGLEQGCACGRTASAFVAAAAAARGALCDVAHYVTWRTM